MSPSKLETRSEITGNEKLDYEYMDLDPSERDSVYHWRRPSVLGDPDSEAEDGDPDEQSDPEDQSDSRIRERHGKSFKADTRGRRYEVDARGDKVL